MTEYYEGPTGRKRLLRTYEDVRMECFDDLLFCCAVTVEDALLLGGSVPGIDYTRIKLFELAMPLALSRANETTRITTGIPDSHPSAGLPVSAAMLADRAELEVMNDLREHTNSRSNKIVARLRRPVIQQLRSLIEKGLVYKYTPENEYVPVYHLTPNGYEYLGGLQ